MADRIISTNELCDFLITSGIDFKTLGAHQTFDRPAQLGKSNPKSLVWSKTLSSDALACPSSVLMLPYAAANEVSEQEDKLLVFVHNPRDVFRRVVLELFAEDCMVAKGVRDDGMFRQLSESVWIAHTATVAKDAQLGSENVIIHPGVTIYPGVKLGNNVEILPGCTIGAPGFGHVRQEGGALEPFPHIGGVHIGDNVMVGSHTCIDSGGLSPTLIGDGVRVGNLTQIAHNVEIERNCLVGTRVQVAGGTRIGEGTEIWAGVTISNNRKIGRNCNIKIGAIVITHLPDGAVVSGNFAIPHDRNLELFAKLRSPL